MVFQPDKKNKYSMRVAVQKIFCVVIAAALAISLTACQKNSDGAESAVSAASASTTGTTYTGTVTEISEESITISTEDGATVTAAMTSDIQGSQDHNYRWFLPLHLSLPPYLFHPLYQVPD